MIDFNRNIKKYQLKTEMPPLPEGYPISAKIVADSIQEWGGRITTFELVFPRYILAEFNTHRDFSRNASSSRAIPTKKLIANSLENMVLPVRFGVNQPGMQAKKENLEGEALEEALVIWKNLAKITATMCERLAELGLHKQWASRPCEWFATIKVVMTTTKYDNFFILRDHKDAQDEICYLSQSMKTAMNNSDPILIKKGDWHLPYVTKEELSQLELENAVKVSSARCARVSYKTVHGVTSTLEEDLAMFQRLVHDLDDQENPFHASPTEHQATVYSQDLNLHDMGGNFGASWVQHRKVIESGISINDL
jgi:thymidylate synthase ThyX